MIIIFIIVWVFVLISAWITSSSTILDGDDKAETFKIKSWFYWGSILLTFFAGYYLTK